MFGKRGRKAIIGVLVATGIAACAEGHSGTNKTIGSNAQEVPEYAIIHDPRFQNEFKQLGRRILAGRADTAVRNLETLYEASGGDTNSAEFNRVRAAFVELAHADSIIRDFISLDVNKNAMTNRELDMVHEVTIALEEFQKLAPNWPAQLKQALCGYIIADISQMERQLRIQYERSQTVSESGMRGKLQSWLNEQGKRSYERFFSVAAWINSYAQ